jgi:hypothetical protein
MRYSSRELMKVVEVPRTMTAKQREKESTADMKGRTPREMEYRMPGSGKRMPGLGWDGRMS